MAPRFECAAASVVGREHARVGRNNQDAVEVTRAPEALIAVVADGCGSSRASEVGARIGVRLLSRALHDELSRKTPLVEALEAARCAVLRELGRLAEALGPETVHEQLLFTLVGAAIARREAATFALGDGLVGLNGALVRLEAPGNAPDYLAYALAADARPLRFAVVHQVATSDVASIVVGSDGASDVAALGLVPSLVSDDGCFRNPDGLARRLRLLNRETTRIDWDARRVSRAPTALPDDTTLVLIRRAAA